VKILHFSASFNVTKCVRLPFFYKKNRGERERKTALHIAAESDFADMAEVLLNFGADVALRTSDGSTALHLAAKNQSSRVLRQILEKVGRIRRVVLPCF
jgi:ankyrin repeat protein